MDRFKICCCCDVIHCAKNIFFCAKKIIVISSAYLKMKKHLFLRYTHPYPMVSFNSSDIRYWFSFKICKSGWAIYLCESLLL